MATHAVVLSRTQEFISTTKIGIALFGEDELPILHRKKMECAVTEFGVGVVGILKALGSRLHLKEDEIILTLALSPERAIEAAYGNLEDLANSYHLFEIEERFAEGVMRETAFENHVEVSFYSLTGEKTFEATREVDIEVYERAKAQKLTGNARKAFVKQAWPGFGNILAGLRQGKNRIGVSLRFRLVTVTKKKNKEGKETVEVKSIPANIFQGLLKSWLKFSLKRVPTDLQTGVPQKVGEQLLSYFDLYYTGDSAGKQGEYPSTLERRPEVRLAMHEQAVKKLIARTKPLEYELARNLFPADYGPDTPPEKQEKGNRPICVSKDYLEFIERVNPGRYPGFFVNENGESPVQVYDRNGSLYAFLPLLTAEEGPLMPQPGAKTDWWYHRKDEFEPLAFSKKSWPKSGTGIMIPLMYDQREGDIEHILYKTQGIGTVSIREQNAQHPNMSGARNASGRKLRALSDTRSDGTRVRNIADRRETRELAFLDFRREGNDDPAWQEVVRRYENRMKNLGHQMQDAKRALKRGVISKERAVERKSELLAKREGIRGEFRRSLAGRKKEFLAGRKLHEGFFDEAPDSNIIAKSEFKWYELHFALRFSSDIPLTNRTIGVHLGDRPIVWWQIDGEETHGSLDWATPTDAALARQAALEQDQRKGRSTARRGFSKQNRAWIVKAGREIVFTAHAHKCSLVVEEINFAPEKRGKKKSAAVKRRASMQWYSDLLAVIKHQANKKGVLCLTISDYRIKFTCDNCRAMRQEKQTEANADTFLRKPAPGSWAPPVLECRKCGVSKERTPEVLAVVAAHLGREMVEKEIEKERKKLEKKGEEK